MITVAHTKVFWKDMWNQCIKEIKLHKCSFCDYSFSRKSNLLVHERNKKKWSNKSIHFKDELLEAFPSITKSKYLLDRSTYDFWNNIVKCDFFIWSLHFVAKSLSANIFQFLNFEFICNFWILPVIRRKVNKPNLFLKISKMTMKFKIVICQASTLQIIKRNSDLHGKFMHPISSPHWMGVGIHKAWYDGFSTNIKNALKRRFCISVFDLCIGTQILNVPMPVR